MLSNCLQTSAKMSSTLRSAGICKENGGHAYRSILRYGSAVCVTYLCTLFFVRVHDRLGMLVKGVQPLLDCLDIVVNSSRGLSAINQTLRHGGIADFKVEDLCAWTDLLLKLLSLRWQIIGSR
jgi:hypothetical protein